MSAAVLYINNTNQVYRFSTSPGLTIWTVIWKLFFFRFLIQNSSCVSETDGNWVYINCIYTVFNSSCCSVCERRLSLWLTPDCPLNLSSALHNPFDIQKRKEWGRQTPMSHSSLCFFLSLSTSSISLTTIDTTSLFFSRLTRCLSWFFYVKCSKLS